jgi:3D-(3,5/4)-trihydroxycyclohexane-1,2-dione acylhydrolase (decyclizing)
MLRDARGPNSDVRVDFVAHAASLGAYATRASSIPELEAAIEQARGHDRTSVVVVDVRESDWTEGGLFWQVGVPEVSELAGVREARAAHEAGLATQRRGT